MEAEVDCWLPLLAEAPLFSAARPGICRFLEGETNRWLGVCVNASTAPGLKCCGGVSVFDGGRCLALSALLASMAPCTSQMRRCIISPSGGLPCVCGDPLPYVALHQMLKAGEARGDNGFDISNASVYCLWM